jgi:sec-independent protein translocase protein TatA
MDFLGIGFGEIVLILVVAVIVLGPGKIPEIARTIGRTMRALRKATSDFTTAVTREMEAEEERLSQTKAEAPIASKDKSELLSQPGIVPAAPAETPTAKDE